MSRDSLANAVFSFKREAYWLVVIGVAPLLAILFSILIPGLWRRLFA